LHRFPSRPGLANDEKLAVCSQQGAQSLAHDRVIIGNEDSDLGWKGH
jgi:hypothetical protein